MILILDFGSQTTHLIARRIRDLGIKVKILPGDTNFHKNRRARQMIKNLKGIILSGGPRSVYLSYAPLADKQIYNLYIPILGICYGLQSIVYQLGGKVKPSGQREFGPEKLTLRAKHILFNQTPQVQTVWLSHADEVIKLPEGFKILASTRSVVNTVITNDKQKIYGVQFHPEVEHTKYGQLILKNFLEKICQLKTDKKKINVPAIITNIKNKVGEAKVIAAVSGGVDSTVAASLTVRAIGANLIPIYIDNGLMRMGTKEAVIDIFKKHLNIDPVIIRAKRQFLSKLKGVINPEGKRQIIGNLYVRLFENEAKKHKKAEFLLQGTIYSDVIESKGSQHADKIKSHHNVGGLPFRLKLKLLEPLRDYYKDEVRLIGRELNLPEEVINKQPFPGPGAAIRILGEVTHQRLAKQHQADQIILDELKKAGLYQKVFQSFPVLTNAKSTAVKGDARVYGDVVALRIYQSSNIMTAGWSRLPYNLLQKISSRIVNEVPQISRVVYDITTKPPATMEWE